MFVVNVLLFLVTCANAAIVPQELPSLLSVAYSNIPPIKKGTDSRVGFGFSLGNHADFQVLFELGPQSETNPIGMPYPSSSKRQAVQKVQKTSPTKRKATTTDGGKYLANWSQNLKQKKVSKPFEPMPMPGDNTNAGNSPDGTVNLQQIIATMGMQDGVINQPKPDLPRGVLTQLEELYGDQKKNVEDDKVEEVKKVVVDRPRFVPKRKQNTQAMLPTIPSYHRLAQFNVQEERSGDLKKRKITADLSDVSLDDE